MQHCNSEQLTKWVVQNYTLNVVYNDLFSLIIEQRFRIIRRWF